MFDPTELSVVSLHNRLAAGELTSVELVSAYLRRIAAYDRQGPRLNALVELNPNVFAEARAADERRAAGRSLGVLDGIPYTAKDSYKVEGMTVAAGSPAFANLKATEDAYSVAALRAAGAVFIGLTNMPPMADGGMQRGVYGRAESPYNEFFLTAAFVSGSSNGAGTATASSFSAFGLAEETWSSGRAPASNNGLVAYTPSRGIISSRGNWPLVPTMDVVVPYARSVPDLLAVLDVLVADDPESRGDFWRSQTVVDIPKPSEIRPDSYAALADQTDLHGQRFGIPRMYINADTEAEHPIATRASVVRLWQQAKADLESLGAEVVAVDFPVVSNYEEDRPGATSMVTRGMVPSTWEHTELHELSAWAMNDFLEVNGDPNLPDLAHARGADIFPNPPDAVAYDSGNEADLLAEYVGMAGAGLPEPADLPGFAAALRGLERTRVVDFEDWMADLGLDAVVLPTSADVAPFDADFNPKSNEIAYRNGTWVANGNLVPRHLGIPTVTVPMGVMDDIHMPVGLTFAGRAYDDATLLRFAAAFDGQRTRRIVPPRTPALPEASNTVSPSVDVTTPTDRDLAITLNAETSAMRDDGNVDISITGKLEGVDGAVRLLAYVNGEQVPATVTPDGEFSAAVAVPARAHYVWHSAWRGPYGSIVQVLAHTSKGDVAAYTQTGGI